MSAWKVLFIMLLAATCLGLALATIIVPMTLAEDQSRWLWLAGLLVGTIVMSTLFTLFLRSSDRTFKR